MSMYSIEGYKNYHGSVVVKQGGDPRFYKLLEDLRDLHSRKNTDYSRGGSQGPLGNFPRVSQIKRLYPQLDWASPLGTALDYLLKQLDAALILYQAGGDSLTGEPVPSRLKDVAVYALLGMLLYEDEPKKATGSVEAEPGLRYP